MNKEEEDKIKGELLSDMFNGIKNVIDNNIIIYSNKFLAPNDISKYLIEIGFVDLEEFDSTGWEYNNWNYFIYNNEKYIVSGSGYYGGIKISKTKY